MPSGKKKNDAKTPPKAVKSKVIKVNKRKAADAMVATTKLTRSKSKVAKITEDNNTEKESETLYECIY